MVQSLLTTWSELGRRAAVIAGAGVALLALVQDCPVWVASARGAGALVAVALIAHGVAGVLAWSADGDRAEARARMLAEHSPALAEQMLSKNGGLHE
jgi:hypothetical protein